MNIKQKAGRLGFFTKIVIFALFLIVAWKQFDMKIWNKQDKILAWDVVSYYGYLPVFFVYNDIRMDFEDEKPAFDYVQWASKLPNGGKVFKMSMGVSYMMAPAFLGVHAFQHISGGETDGSSSPYLYSIFLSALIYLTLGLFFLAKSLSRFFNDYIVGITLIAIAIGTNLFYYSTSEPGMSHVYLFFLISLFIFLTIKWHENPNFKYSLFTGLTAGLIILARPTNALILLIFVFYDVNSFESIITKFCFYRKHFYKLLIITGFFIIPIIPQLIYWKINTGSYIHYSYGEEGFYFLKPHIIQGLLGFRKGWLIYTPMMILALAGFFFTRKKLMKFRFAMIVFVVLNIYVVLSWWCWWYGGSFGLRAFIESYAVLAFPLAALFSAMYVNTKMLKKVLMSVILISFIWLNQFQTSQYITSLLHYDSMNFKTYKAIFLTKHWPANYDELKQEPDYDSALKGEKERLTD